MVSVICLRDQRQSSSFSLDRIAGGWLTKHCGETWASWPRCSRSSGRELPRVHLAVNVWQVPPFSPPRRRAGQRSGSSGRDA